MEDLANHSLFQNLSDELRFTLNYQGNVINANQTFLEIAAPDFQLSPSCEFTSILSQRSKKAWEMAFLQLGDEKTELKCHIETSGGPLPFKLFFLRTDEHILISAKNISEFDQIHKKRNETERNYNSLMKAIDQGFVFQDTSGVIRSANTAALNILGLDMDQLQGRKSPDPRWKSIHEDGSDFPGETHPAMVVLKTQKAMTGVIMGVYNPRYDKTKWIRIDAYPQFNFSTDEFLGANSFFTDITLFKEVKDQSNEKEVLLRQVINSSTEISFISTDSQGLIQTFNTGAEKLLGYQASEIIGTQSLTAFHDSQELETRSMEISETYLTEIRGFEVLTFLPRMLDKGEKRKWLYTHKSGRQVKTEVTITSVHNSKKELTGYLAIAVDISQEEATKKWNEDLLNELIRFKEGLDHAALVSMTDPKGRITFANKNFIETSGYQYEELFLKHHRIIKSRRHPPAFYKQMWDTISSGNIWTGEVCNLAKDGSEYWVTSVIVPFKDKNNKITHYLSIRHDITQEKQATHRAIKASKAKSEFLANMSHEIRTPMNGVIGMTDLLLETTLDEEQLDLAKTVKDSANSLLNIINDILDFSKIEAGKLTIESTAFDLSVVCSTVIKIMKFRTEEVSLYCDLYFDECINSMVRGDPTRLKQILNNLVGNAIKFTKKGGVSLKVTPAQETHWIRFAIEDTGIGISPEMVNSVFDKFTQAETSTTRNFGGTGLGLSITKQLVELMGGRIGVSSEAGLGSCFWFEIEFPPAQQELKQIETYAESKINLASVRVLVAEDNKINQKVVQGVLKKFHITPTFAINGQECLEKLVFSDYDIIFMDMHMPIMDGENATKEIRSNPNLINLPIIAMTAHAGNGFRDHCLKIGMNDFITKPFHHETIKKAILKWVK